MIAQILHYIPHAVVFVMCLGLLCIALSDRTQKEPIERCKGCAHCQPDPLPRQRPVSERLPKAKGLNKRRKAWAARQDLEGEIYGMIGDVREGDER